MHTHAHADAVLSPSVLAAIRDDAERQELLRAVDRLERLMTALERQLRAEDAGAAPRGDQPARAAASR